MIVCAYIRALPKLEAEETVRQVMATAAGGGNLSKDDARDYMKGLNRAIYGGKPPPRKVATNREIRELFGAKG